MKSETRNPRWMIRKRFAIKFVEAMKKLNKKRASKHKRYLAVRAAACVSMASAVGPRRAWSRAVLKNVVVSTSRRRRRRRSRNPKDDVDEEEDVGLRRLVPGGERMGHCRLLSESADYIMCLRDQDHILMAFANGTHVWCEIN